MPAGSDVLAASRAGSTAVRTLHGTLMMFGLAGVLAADAWLGGRVAFAAALAGLVAAGLAEFYRLAGRAGARPAAAFGTALGVILVAAQWLKDRFGHEWPLTEIDPVVVAAGGALFGAVICQVARHGVANAWMNVGATILGLACVWFPASFVWGIRRFGLGALVMFVCVVKMSDVAAYFVGRAVGRRPLAPVVSPKKTIAGAWGGLAAGVLTAAAFRLALPDHSGGLGVIAALLFGVLTTTFGMLGDLGESLLKRAAAVKDASSLVPGFGGLLDVIDSPLGAAPMAFLVLSLWGVPQ